MVRYNKTAVCIFFLGLSLVVAASIIWIMLEESIDYNNQFNQIDCTYTFHGPAYICDELQCAIRADTVIAGFSLVIPTGEPLDDCTNYTLSNFTSCYYTVTTCPDYKTVLQLKSTTLLESLVITGWIVGWILVLLGSYIANEGRSRIEPAQPNPYSGPEPSVSESIGESISLSESASNIEAHLV